MKNTVPLAVRFRAKSHHPNLDWIFLLRNHFGGELFRLDNLVLGHGTNENTLITNCIFVSLSGSKIKPLVSLDIILRYTEAIHIHCAEAVLC